MSVSKFQHNQAYGLQNALQSLAPEPIISKRNPSAADKAEFGTVWINTVTKTSFILAGNGDWVQVQGGATSAVSVSGSLTATNNALVGKVVFTGNTLLDGDTAEALIINNSNVSLLTPILVSVSSTNVSTNGAVITIAGSVQTAGVLTVHVANIGIGTLATNDSIIVTYMILS